MSPVFSLPACPAILSATERPASAHRLQRHQRASVRGFTLVEILVAAKNDIAAISQALKLYRLDNGRYPTSEQGLSAMVSKPTLAPIPPNWKPNGYLERLPKDPWGNPYQYLNPGLRGEIDIFSFGADGSPGGAGIDADIGSWDN
jgi:general secretion pathway protein G